MHFIQNPKVIIKYLVGKKLVTLITKYHAPMDSKHVKHTFD